MLSVFMDCGPDDRKLAQTLATLVSGAVTGLVREVVLIDRAMSPASRKVAEHSGCRIVSAEDFRSAIASAKGDWILCLEPGARLQPGWQEAIGEHFETGASAKIEAGAARFRRAAVDKPGFLSRIRQIRTAMAEGFLVKKPQAIGLSRLSFTLEEMARGVAVGRMAAEIRPAPHE